MKKKIDKEILNAEMQRLYDRDGQVTAPKVLEESEHEDAPLHHLFEWDDSAAAKQYRLNQARKLIRVSWVVHKGEKQRLIHVPSTTIDIEKEQSTYVPSTTIDTDKKDKSGYYQVPSVLVEIPSEFERAMEEALSALSSARRRVKALEKAARDAGEDDTSARIAMALRALETAQEAIRTR